MLRIFFLVLSQLSVGGFALLSLVPLAEIGKGFFRTCALIYLLIMALVLVGLDGVRPLELIGFVLFVLLLILYSASLWFDRLPNSMRLLKTTLTIGICAVVASALSYPSTADPPGESILRVVNFLFSTLSLGCWAIGTL